MKWYHLGWWGPVELSINQALGASYGFERLNSWGVKPDQTKRNAETKHRFSPQKKYEFLKLASYLSRILAVGFWCLFF